MRRQRKMRPMLDRFWEKIDTSNGPDACWPWTAGTSGEYGEFATRPGVPALASRLAWELTYAEKIPDTLCALHSCDNPPCCNPKHLFLGTRGDNSRDKHAKGRDWQSQRTHCPFGHEYTPDNLKPNPNGRDCRDCHRRRNREYQRQRRAKIV